MNLGMAAAIGCGILTILFMLWLLSEIIHPRFTKHEDSYLTRKVTE